MKFLKSLFVVVFLGTANLSLAAKEIIALIVPTPPGGAIDLTARAISKALTVKGVHNRVVYHPGANGDIALGKVLENRDRSILIASSANFVFSNLVFNRDNIYIKDLELIGPSLTNAMAFYAPLNKPIKSINDLVDQAKKTETPCATSNSHGELQLMEMNKRFGTKFVNVPYRGTGQLIPDLIGGHVGCAYDQIAPYTQLQDKIIILATSGEQSYKSEIPTINNTFANYTFTTWYAVGIPKNSPLLKNVEILNVLTTWNQDKDLVGPLVERSFVPTRADAKLNDRALKETQYHQTVSK